LCLFIYKGLKDLLLLDIIRQMAPKNIDYSKTVMYKIVCNDLSIKDCYVGHISDFRKRKYNHKNTCNNNISKFKVYQFIRVHGGWENWTMVMIEQYPCNNVLEASRRERYWVEQLNATLNTCVPSRTNKQYNEETNCNKKYYELNKDKIRQFRKTQYLCDCGSRYTCCHKLRHEQTAKHQHYINNRLYYTIKKGLEIIKALNKHFYG